MKRLLIYVLIVLMAFTPIADADGETSEHRIYASAAPTFALTEGRQSGQGGSECAALLQSAHLRRQRYDRLQERLRGY